MPLALNKVGAATEIIIDGSSKILPSDSIKFDHIGTQIRVFGVKNIGLNKLYDYGEISIAGVACSSYDDFKTKLAAAFPNAGATASTTKVYRALLHQESTDTPVATVLENSFGGTIVWARTGAGAYTATLSGAFTANKTFCIPPNNNLDTPSTASQARLIRSSDNICTLYTLSDGSPSDDLLGSGSAIQILVYP